MNQIADLQRNGAVPQPPAPLRSVPPLWSDDLLAANLRQTLGDWSGQEDLWVFAYGSLIWNPEIAYVESRKAKVFGLHRRLCLWSTINRGTPECPGLVLALDIGGSCEGLAYRVRACDVQTEFTRLWMREMLRGSYSPSWVKTHTPEGIVRSLAFVMIRNTPTYAGRLDDETLMAVLTHSCGCYGTSADYVCRTARALKEHGLCDARLQRIVDRFERSCSPGCSQDDGSVG